MNKYSGQLDLHIAKEIVQLEENGNLLFESVSFFFSDAKNDEFR